VYVSHSVTEIEQCCIFIRVFFYLLCIKHFYCCYKVRGCVVNLVDHCLWPIVYSVWDTVYAYKDILRECPFTEALFTPMTLNCFLSANTELRLLIIVCYTNTLTYLLRPTSLISYSLTYLCVLNAPRHVKHVTVNNDLYSSTRQQRQTNNKSNRIQIMHEAKKKIGINSVDKYI